MYTHTHTKTRLTNRFYVYKISYLTLREHILCLESRGSGEYLKPRQKKGEWNEWRHKTTNF